MCDVQLDLDIFVKLTVQIRIALEKQWRGGNAAHKGKAGILMGNRGWGHCVVLLY